ncbi:sigma-70 family RNA polymerase sigma factor [Micromonosporaceae bacterium B7E4]
MGVTQERLERFEANRRRLFGVAYRLLGEASEAEDVVQDAYLRWERSDSVVSPEAWLTRVVTNLCLDRLTSARAQRERYVGPWLPEPVLTGGGALDPLETVEQRELLSLGMLVLLERLTPPERAVFVLREAFGHGHREIAEILEVNEPHVIGDAAAAHTRDGQVLRMGCGPGGLAAACAVHAIADRLAGRTPEPLRVRTDALCVSLGRWDGLLQPTDLDGSPRGKVRTGRPVAMLKRAVLHTTGTYNLRYPALALAAARQG